MNAKQIGALLLLSALWGGSFLFMRIAAPVLGPVVLIELRVLIAGVALLLYMLATRSPLDLRTRWKHYLVIGIINSAIPFTLIATSELYLTAGLAATLNATTPLFGAVVAALWIKETLTKKKVIGLVLGLFGVSVLVGWSPFPFSTTLVVSVAVSLAAAACYGIGGVYTKVFMYGASSKAVATCSQLGAALFLLPLTFVVPSKHAPTPIVLLSVISLALLCTAVAYLIYFWLIEHAGPTRALTVTFLAPIFGVLWGTILLSEPLNLSTFIGFGIILVGTGFVTGVRLRKKTVVPSVKQTQRDAKLFRHHDLLKIRKRLLPFPSYVYIFALLSNRAIAQTGKNLTDAIELPRMLYQIHQRTACGETQVTMLICPEIEISRDH